MTLNKVLDSLVEHLLLRCSVEHLLLCYRWAAVHRWKQAFFYTQLAGFDLIQSTGQVLARMQKVYNWELSLQVLAYTEDLQTIK